MSLSKPPAPVLKSLAVVALGGFVGIIGFTGGHAVNLDVWQVIGSPVRLQDISTGLRSTFEGMNRAAAQHELKPITADVLPLAWAAELFAQMERGGHFGKIGIQYRLGNV